MAAKRTLAIGATGVLAVAAGTTLAVRGAGGAAIAASPDATPTTQIVRKDLVETETVDGTLEYGDARAVINHLAGTVTWMPADSTLVHPGHRLYKVDGANVFLLDGSYPAYRTLAPGIAGRDVQELERSLRELGFDHDHDMKIDRRWNDATTAAVERWQKHVHMAADGSIELGRVVFAPGSRRVAEHDIALGGSATGGGASSATATQGAAYQATTGARTVFADYRATTRPRTVQARYENADAPPPRQAASPTPVPSTTPTAVATATSPYAAPTPSSSAVPTPPAVSPTPAPSTAPVLPVPTTSTAPAGPGSGALGASGGTAPTGGFSGGGVPSSSASPGAASAATGSTAAVATQIMTTTSTREVVSVDLDTSKLELAERGATAKITMPRGNVVDGTITAVGSVATTARNADGSDGDTTVAVTIAVKPGAGGRLDQAPVDVDLERQRVKDALTIPVTALQALSGNRFGVEVHDSHGKRMVTVIPGLYTDGDVQITGPGLAAGMTVTDARV